MDWFSDLVVVVNPSTGRRDVLSFTPADGSLTTGNAQELEYDALADRYVINDFSENISTRDSDQLLSVDPVTGTRAVLYKDTLGAGPAIQGLASLAADLDSGIIYVGSSTSDSISRVDLVSGERTILSSNTLGTGALIGNIRGLFADPANNRLFMLDADSASLDLVDTSSGDRIRMTGGFVGSGPSMSLPVALTFDSASDTAYIVDQSLSAVFAVDTLLGTRQIISDDSSAGTPFTEPTGIALDADNGRLLVTDNGTGNTLTVTLYAVDLATGARTVLSSLGTGSGENFTRLEDVEFVPDRGLAIVTTGESLIIVDLQSGNRTLLASSLSGNGESISNLSDIAFDPKTNLVYGWNPNFEAVFVYSAETGDRVVLSK
jgi:DNA-binding beta-propeller fold protein YncE